MLNQSNRFKFRKVALLFGVLLVLSAGSAFAQTKLYVGNLSFQTTEDDLLDLFSQAGEVVCATIVVDKETGRSRGFGYVVMITPIEAEEAISRFHGIDFNGRIMRVVGVKGSNCDEPVKQEQKTEAPKQSEAPKKDADKPKQDQNTTPPNSNATSAPTWADCPPFPSALAGVLRWEAMRVPNMLLCRALLTDSGAEAFALTVIPDELFNPRRSDRAESARLHGRELFWYRVKLPNQPNLEVRETLIQIAEDRFVHVSVRANDAQTLSRYQGYVLSLPFPNYVE